VFILVVDKQYFFKKQNKQWQVTQKEQSLAHKN